jgi:hypothetical protein
VERAFTTSGYRLSANPTAAQYSEGTSGQGNTVRATPAHSSGRPRAEVGGAVVDTLVGFHVDAWDYLTFAAMFIIVAAVLTLAVLILGLPGRIAVARKHPEADAVNLMGYVGFLAVVPWINALI